MTPEEAEQLAREAWLKADKDVTNRAEMIAYELAAGRVVGEDQLHRYRVAVAAREGLSAAYDKHLHRKGRAESHELIAWLAEKRTEVKS